MSISPQAMAFARALLRHAEQANILDAVRADVEALLNQWQTIPELRTFAQTMPAGTPRDHAERIHLIWGDALTPCVRIWLEQMARWGALTSLEAATRHFLTRCDLKQGRRQACVAFACPPDEADLAALREMLTEDSDSSVELETSVDPKLLAGFRLTIGDRWIDASLAGRIQRMRKRAEYARI